MKVYFVDTNYFLRFILGDNKEQSATVRSLFEKGLNGTVTLVTSTIVFFEIYWVLKSSLFHKEKRELISVLRNILKLSFIRMDEVDILHNVLDLYENENIEFEDCYNIIFSKRNDVVELATFDKKLSGLYSRISDT